MKETKQKSLVLIITTIALFVAAIIGATYAYFATTTRIDANIGVNIETSGTSYTFTASSSDRISMNITAADMAEANVSSEKIKSETGTIEVSLASPTDDIITSCSYDIIWVWESDQKYTTPEEGITFPYISDAGLEEIGQHMGGENMSRERFNEMVEVYKNYNGYEEEAAYAELSQSVKNGIFFYEFSTKVHGYKEHDISNLEAGKTANSIILQKGAGISSKDTTEVTQTHTVEVNVYNLPVVQEKLYDKTFAAHITIENVQCTMTDSKEATSLATYITNNVYNSPENLISLTDHKSGAGLYKHDASLTNGANDNSYRYAGADEEVNNYVCFAGSDCTVEENLYRIISVDSSNKTKIIKATNVGYMLWNNLPEDYDWKTVINNWEESILDTYLNGEYLSGMGNKMSIINTTTWNVGGANRNSLETKNVHDFMLEELNNSTTYSAKIGLMYASDYGFAALPELWEKPLDNYQPSIGKDWMLTAGLSWTISHLSDVPDRAFIVKNNGGMGESRDVSWWNDHYIFNRVHGVRPVFNLSSSAKLINAGTEGVGSKSNPMIII